MHWIQLRRTLVDGDFLLDIMVIYPLVMANVAIENDHL
jgi:hypothetical protein